MVRWNQAELSPELLASAEACFRPDLYDDALGASARAPCSPADGIGAFFGPKFDAVDSSDERNAVCKLSGWRHEAKCFPRSGVEFERNGIEIGLGGGGEVKRP